MGDLKGFEPKKEKGRLRIYVDLRQVGWEMCLKLCVMVTAF